MADWAYPALRFPPGWNRERFLSEGWQQRALLMRGALPGIRSPIDADELAGLACEPEVESRIVHEHGPDRPWQVWHGPFSPGELASLPESHWTLLVQDVDKHLPAVAELLHQFDFIPEWRLDDIMISYAADQGSVGPHWDAYDVFLVQVQGRRRWRIDSRNDAEARSAALPDLDLRILQRFEPDRDWLLEPGDLLYLPPGAPHWGIAEGPCMTWSVGVRAPSWQELAEGWMSQAVERLAEAGRWRDAPDTLPADAAELPRRVLAAMRQRLHQALLDTDPEQFDAWLGALLTEPKDNLLLEPQDPPLADAEVLALLRDRGCLVRDPRSRLLFRPADGPQGADLLFAGGSVHRLQSGYRPFLALLCRRGGVRAVEIAPWMGHQDCAALLGTLYNAGHFCAP